MHHSVKDYLERKESSYSQKKSLSQAYQLMLRKGGEAKRSVLLVKTMCPFTLKYAKAASILSS